MTLFEYLSLFEPLARGSFWYKCHPCTWDLRIFHPTPPHLHFIHNISSSHVPPSYLSHFWHLFYFRKNHLRNFRLGLTRVLFFCLSFGMGQLFPYPVVTVEPMYFKIYHLIEDHIFRDMILEENPVTARGLQHLGWRPRAKNPTQILVREKKSAPLACLWLSNALHDACSDCYYNFSDVLKPSPRLFLPPKKNLQRHETAQDRRHTSLESWFVPYFFFRSLVSSKLFGWESIVHCCIFSAFVESKYWWKRIPIFEWFECAQLFLIFMSYGG